MVIITRYSFLEPYTDELLDAIGRDLDPALARRGASWQRSYGKLDRLELVAEFYANDLDDVRQAHADANVGYADMFAAQCWTAEEQLAARGRTMLAEHTESRKKETERAQARPIAVPVT